MQSVERAEMDRPTSEANDRNGASIFDPASMALYARIRRELGAGHDVTADVARLSASFEAGLERLASNAARDEPGALEKLQVQKRVVHELAYDLVRSGELGEARTAVARLLGRSSVYRPLPHPRYLITQDWFSHNVPAWKKALGAFVDRPDVRCLEIGSFEGLSACWLLENVLTHQTSRILCIDPFDLPGQPQAERYFDHNVASSGSLHKVTKLKGYSGQVLPLLSRSTFDIAYIDGSHAPGDTLKDALSVWPLLRPHGVMIFDDYAIGSSYPKEVIGSVDPKPGIDAFLAFLGGGYETLAADWQLIIAKE